MCSRQVNLTEEEKETLKAEGLPIPTTLPLTKVGLTSLSLTGIIMVLNSTVKPLDVV